MGRLDKSSSRRESIRIEMSRLKNKLMDVGFQRSDDWDRLNVHW